MFVKFCQVKKACMGDGGERERALDDVFDTGFVSSGFPVKSRKIKDMTTGDKGKLFILFILLFTLSLLSKIVCSM